MKREMTVRFAVQGETGSGRKHHVYWLPSGELVLADHGDQTFAQFMSTWNLMGQPQGPCNCPQFVLAFRNWQQQGTRYCTTYRQLESATRSFGGNLLALVNRAEWLSNLRDYRRNCVVSQQDPLANQAGHKSALRAGVETRKRTRFQRTMAPVFESLNQQHRYSWPAISYDWSQDTSALGQVYADFTVHGTRQANPALSVRVNAHAWDAMRRGWNRVADPSNNPIMGAKLVRHPDTGVPVLCFKCIVVTTKPGIQRFRIGYRYMGLVPNADGQLIEDWLPFHDLRAVTDAKNDRY